eukprot:6183230-Pleurochrysis_carterae.AAC.6
MATAWLRVRATPAAAFYAVLVRPKGRRRVRDEREVGLRDKRAQPERQKARACASAARHLTSSWEIKALTNVLGALEWAWRAVAGRGGGMAHARALASARIRAPARMRAFSHFVPHVLVERARSACHAGRRRVGAWREGAPAAGVAARALGLANDPQARVVACGDAAVVERRQPCVLLHRLKARKRVLLELRAESDRRVHATLSPRLPLSLDHASYKAASYVGLSPCFPPPPPPPPPLYVCAYARTYALARACVRLPLPWPRPFPSTSPSANSTLNRANKTSAKERRKQEGAAPKSQFLPGFASPSNRNWLLHVPMPSPRKKAHNVLSALHSVRCQSPCTGDSSTPSLAAFNLGARSQVSARFTRLLHPREAIATYALAKPATPVLLPTPAPPRECAAAPA